MKYPFILYRLGDYFGAYKKYNKILPLEWNSQRYILYFICLYNIWDIRNGIWSQLCLNETIDAEQILEKVNNINLEEVLSRLPIEEEVRILFQNLLSFNSIGNQSAEVNKLKDDLYS